MVQINYTPPATCRRFMKSDAFMRLIAGPVGSGKTTACLFELFRRACEQEPAQDGIRYTRFAIVRQTLKQLKDTVLKDIISWLDQVARYKVSDSTIYIEFGDVKSEWLLIPLDDPEDQRRLLSMQLTGAWLSECIEMDFSIISPLAGRVGRYPAANLGGASWFGLIADTNMPSEGSDWHKYMTEPPPDAQIFIQPGGLEEEAENLEWLLQTPETLQLAPDDPKRRDQGREYYRRFVRSNSPDWCKRYVHAKFGDDPSGTAVFRESFKSHGAPSGAVSRKGGGHRRRPGRHVEVHSLRRDQFRSRQARGFHGVPGTDERHREAYQRRRVVASRFPRRRSRHPVRQEALPDPHPGHERRLQVLEDPRRYPQASPGQERVLARSRRVPVRLSGGAWRNGRDDVSPHEPRPGSHRAAACQHKRVDLIRSYDRLVRRITVVVVNERPSVIHLDHGVVLEVDAPRVVLPRRAANPRHPIPVPRCIEGYLHPVSASVVQANSRS